MRLKSGLKVSIYPIVALSVSVLALLIAPTAWAAYTVWQGNGGGLGSVGPRTAQASSWGGPGGGPSAGNRGSGRRGGGFGSDADPALLNYLQANRGDAKYLVATINSMSASPIILNTNEPDPVITLGGFMGRDPVLSTEQLADLVRIGEVRFFLVPDSERMEEMMSEYFSSQSSAGQQAAPEGPPGGLGRFLHNESMTWVQDNCEQVPQEDWQSSDSEDAGGPMGRTQILYDCGTQT